MTGEETPLLGSHNADPQSKGDDWKLSKRTLLLLITLNFGTFLAAVDTTIVSTLMSSIASDLRALDNISWVATAYLIAYSAFQPLYGKLSDIYGRKVVLMTVTFLFGLGCQICAMSYSMGPLIIGRLLNGIGAGGMLSICSIAVGDYVPASKRSFYQGITNVAFCLGASSGGLMGSAAENMYGWRFAFSIQVPMSLASLLAISFMDVKKPAVDEIMIEDTQNAGHVVRRSSLERIDFVGSGTLAAGVILLMIAVTTGGHQFAWKSWQIIGCFVGSIGLFAMFGYWEAYRAIEPVFPLELMANKSVLSCCLGNFFGSGAFYSYLYYVPVYVTACHNYTPVKVSKMIICNFVGETMGAITAARIMSKTGRYYTLGVFSGFGLLASGLMFLYFPYANDTIQAGQWWEGMSFMVMGYSYAIFLSVSTISLIAASPKHQATTLSAQHSFRGVGSSVDLAIASALFNHVLSANLNKRITGESAHIIIQRLSKSVHAITKLPIDLREEAIASYRSAAVGIFLLIIVYELLHTFCMTCNKEYKLVEPEDGFAAME